MLCGGAEIVDAVGVFVVADAVIADGGSNNFMKETDPVF